MKTFIRVLVLLFAMVTFAPVGGCVDDGQSAQRIAALQNVLQVTRVAVEDYSAKADAIAAAVDAAAAKLADPNVVGDKLAEVKRQYDELRASYAAVRAKLDETVAVEKVYEAKLAAAQAAGAIDAQQEIALYGEGATAVAPMLPPPWNAVVLALVPVVTAVAGAVVKGRADKKVAEAAQAQHDAEVKGVVTSVDKLVESGLVTDAVAAKKLLAYEQARTEPLAVAAVQRVKSQGDKP